MPDITLWTTEDAGSQVLDIAYAYLEQAINDVNSSISNSSDEYSIAKGSQRYDPDTGSGSETCVDLEDFRNWVTNQPDCGLVSNHVITWMDWSCNPGSDGFCSWSANGNDIANLSTNPVESQTNTDAAHAIQGVLHEVGHSLLRSGLSGEQSHKVGTNRLSHNPNYEGYDYYVTPMLTSYDRQYVGENNYCGDTIQDPASGDRIFLDHTWSSCFVGELARLQ